MNDLYELFEIYCEISKNLNPNAKFDSLTETEIKNFVEREMVIKKMMIKFPDMTYETALKMWEEM